jgi:hypothetical protein
LLGSPQVWVNEVMALNESTLQDEAGGYPDWIELYNPNPDEVDLSGWFLSDDEDNPFRWQLPDGTRIEPNGYLVVFASGDPGRGELHASFRVDVDGLEDVALFGPPEADIPLVDAVKEIAESPPDVSISRVPDGGPTWEVTTSPTPGGPNG